MPLDRHRSINAMVETFELWRNLGDDGLKKAAYRGG